MSSRCGLYVVTSLGFIFINCLVRVRVKERLIEAPGHVNVSGLSFWVTGCCCSGRALGIVPVQVIFDIGAGISKDL